MLKYSCYSLFLSENLVTTRNKLGVNNMPCLLDEKCKFERHQASITYYHIHLPFYRSIGTDAHTSTYPQLKGHLLHNTNSSTASVNPNSPIRSIILRLQSTSLPLLERFIPLETRILVLVHSVGTNPATSQSMMLTDSVADQ